MKYVWLLLCTSPLAALYMGNPAQPQIISQGFWIPEDCSFGVKIGYLGDRVGDRKLKASGHAHGRIDKTRLYFDQGVLTFNLLDRVEIYGSAGSMNAKLSNRPHPDSSRREYQTHDGWTAGTGGRILLTAWKSLAIGVDGKIQWSNPGFKWMAVDGSSRNGRGHFKYIEWQASFALSYTVEWLTPYLGVKYSNVHANINRIPKFIYRHSTIKLVNRDRFGLALGATLSPGKKFDLFAEVQMFDEQAISFGGNLRF